MLITHYPSQNCYNSRFPTIGTFKPWFMGHNFNFTLAIFWIWLLIHFTLWNLRFHHYMRPVKLVFHCYFKLDSVLWIILTGYLCSQKSFNSFSSDCRQILWYQMYGTQLLLIKIQEVTLFSYFTVIVYFSNFYSIKHHLFLYPAIL